MKIVITFGTFDVFHYGHLRLLERASKIGERLIVGVSTDELNIMKKKRAPVFPENERIAIIRALKCVDNAFFEHSLEKKAEYIAHHNADVLVMGDDWSGRFDSLGNICEVCYLERTPAVSTTVTIEKIRAG